MDVDILTALIHTDVDAAVSALSRLTPLELNALSKASVEVQVFLKDSGTFRALFVERKKTPNDVSAIEMDIIDQIHKRDEHVEINYWHTWLCAWQALQDDEVTIIAINRNFMVIMNHLFIARDNVGDAAVFPLFSLCFGGLGPGGDRFVPNFYTKATTTLYFSEFVKMVTGAIDDDDEISEVHENFRLGEGLTTVASVAYKKSTGAIRSIHPPFTHSFGFEIDSINYFDRHRKEINDLTKTIMDHQLDKGHFDAVGALSHFFFTYTRAFGSYILLEKIVPSHKHDFRPYLMIGRSDRTATIIRSCVQCSAPAHYLSGNMPVCGQECQARYHLTE